ncbi:hypothetical protein B0T18DRAFT_419623 [Schizothecium vesticola]|uniref:Uncharacterized protein n=1 Tax=Schizothecium vesticola TaxID=314040 RepID=A0AA40K065_9PEZI|nr:hypothetical protein B0T18DRAFT_419623 [Schizothecium vesticola]
MEMDQIEHLFDILYKILSCLARPLFWTETLFFWILGLRTSTSFRMIPRADTVPDYPAYIAHSYVLISILLIPHFVSRDQYMNDRGALGRPLARGASPLTEYLVMFARVWLAAAWANLAAAQFITDYNPVSFSVKLACEIFIL